MFEAFIFLTGFGIVNVPLHMHRALAPILLPLRNATHHLIELLKLGLVTLKIIGKPMMKLAFIMWRLRNTMILTDDINRFAGLQLILQLTIKMSFRQMLGANRAARFGQFQQLLKPLHLLCDSL